MLSTGSDTCKTIVRLWKTGSNYKICQLLKTTALSVITLDVGFKVTVEGTRAAFKPIRLKEVLKYLKSCFPDADPSCDILKSVVKYCIACTKILTDLLSLLKDKWNLGYSVMVGYLQAISDAVEFCIHQRWI